MTCVSGVCKSVKALNVTIWNEFLVRDTFTIIRCSPVHVDQREAELPNVGNLKQVSS